MSLPFYRVFDLDGPYVLVEVYADLVAPYEGYHNQEYQLFDAFEICKVGLFDIEPTGLHGLEAHLYLPLLGIIVPLASCGRLKETIIGKSPFWSLQPER